MLINIAIPRRIPAEKSIQLPKSCSIPNVDFVKDQLELNEYNQIKIDHRNQRTSAEGIWAAGDCTDALFHQNNIAAGDAVRALEDIYIHLHTR